MATAPTSYAPEHIFTQNQATAALRTWLFHLVKSADSTDATALVPVMTISKAGGAFAAPNVGTAITELTNGWYKVVHNVADFDTAGVLGVRIAVATADTINIGHYIAALDINTATVNVPDGGLTAAKFAAAAIDTTTFTSTCLTAISAPLRSTIKTFAPTADGDFAISMDGAQDVTVEVTGGFGGGSVQVQTTEDPTPGVPVWTNRGAAINASNAASPLVVTGPHNSIRAHVAGTTTPTLAVKFTIRKPDIVR